MKDKHFNSRMLTGAGTLMALSALLISCCGEIAIGGILLAASACMSGSAAAASPIRATDGSTTASASRKTRPIL